jgi:hypothetical protein
MYIRGDLYLTLMVRFRRNGETRCTGTQTVVYEILLLDLHALSF